MLGVVIGWLAVGAIICVSSVISHYRAGQRLQWDWYDYFTLAVTITLWPWALWLIAKGAGDNGNRT